LFEVEFRIGSFVSNIGVDVMICGAVVGFSDDIDEEIFGCLVEFEVKHSEVLVVISDYADFVALDDSWVIGEHSANFTIDAHIKVINWRDVERRGGSSEDITAVSDGDIIDISLIFYVKDLVGGSNFYREDSLVVFVADVGVGGIFIEAHTFCR